MKELKRILGIILLGMALMSAFRIPTNWKSTDPKEHNKVGADVVLILIFGGSGLVLLTGQKKTD